MYRRRPLFAAWSALAVALVLSLIGATLAYAITGGQPDGDAHPQVGMIYDFSTDTLCTGTLISATVVLTAAHCLVDFGDSAETFVFFDSEPAGVESGVAVTGWEAHPDFDNSAWPWTYDVGVVYLAEDPGIGVYGILPELDQLETILPRNGASKQIFTDVGYGQAGVETGGGGPPRANYPYERRVSWQTYHPGGNSWIGMPHGYDEYTLQLKASPSSLHGSGCGGDSGGPIFLDERAIIIAVHTGGKNLGVDGSVCGRIASVNHRIDTEPVLTWLWQFVYV